MPHRSAIIALLASVPLARAEPDVDYGALWRHVPLTQGRRAGEMLPNFDRWLDAQGVSSKATPGDLKTLLALLPADSPARDLLTRAVAAPADTLLRQEACDSAVRTLYASLAQGSYDVLGGKVDGMGPRGSLRMGHHRIAPGVFNSVPYKRSQQLPTKQATNLVDPVSPTRFLTPGDLIGLTHEEIAGLDVSTSNPMWHTRRHMRQAKPDTITQVERDLVDSVSAELGFHYPLERARSVMFWRELPRYGTSPKIKTYDAFGQKWNFKWGEEAIVEPVANRLRLLLGAKYCDLNYTQSGGTEQILILPPAGDRDAPSSLDEFVHAMADSVFEFNARPFIHSSGTLKAADVKTLMPPRAVASDRHSNLVGRTWIRFKESMIEAAHDAIEDAGAATLHTPNALSDRAHRQSLILSLWMHDTDCKEGNYRATWVDGRYYEYFHDTGSCLGGTTRSAELNDLSVRSGPRGFLYPRPGRHRITSREFQVFRPGAWSHVTYADHLAGAKHIVRLTQNNIRHAASYSTMPDYWREVLVWKLAKRRDIVAMRFDLAVADPVGPAPTIGVPLTTRDQRVSAAERYGIPLAEIESDLIRTGHLASPASDTRATFHDLLVREGIIQPYERTVLPGIIRDYLHPAGITERMTRFNDGRPFRSRRFEGLQ